MNPFEKKSTIEVQKTLSPEKQELLELEKEGRFVFHGTASDTNELQPMQAVDVSRGPDGTPAIFASPATDFAIFHAIINSKNFPNKKGASESGATTNDNITFELRFGLPEGALAQLADDASGLVYVFDKKDFKQIEGRPAEYASTVPVQPLRKVRVSKHDLPENIEILNP